MIGNTRSRAAVGVVALAAVVAVAILADNAGDDRETSPSTPASTDEDTLAGESESDVVDNVETSETAADTVAEPEPPELPDRGLHPELIGIDGWLQSEVTSLEELRGKVVAVQFWTLGCRNCKATMPHMRALYAKYQADGLEIVGIHSPEFDYEAEVDNIVAAAAELGVTWPIALDTRKRSFHSWQEGPTGFWPRIYLLDRQGRIRYDHTGEGRYDEIDAAVGALLDEPT